MSSPSAGVSLTSRPPRILSRRRSVALDEGYTTYTNPAGMPTLREAIAARSTRTPADLLPLREIIVTSGAQEAIAVTMQTLLDPGDEVLLATPYYTAYEANILLAGGGQFPAMTRRSEEFQIMPTAIEELLTDRTKLLALVSPNNPMPLPSSRKRSGR